MDAWCVKLFKKENIAYAAACQGIGMGLGFFVTTALYFMLDIITASNFWFTIGVLIFLMTFYIHFFVPESPEEKENPNTPTRSLF